MKKRLKKIFCIGLLVLSCKDKWDTELKIWADKETLLNQGFFEVSLDSKLTALYLDEVIIRDEKSEIVYYRPFYVTSANEGRVYVTSNLDSKGIKCMDLLDLRTEIKTEKCPQQKLLPGRIYEIYIRFGINWATKVVYR